MIKRRDTEPSDRPDPFRLYGNTTRPDLGPAFHALAVAALMQAVRDLKDTDPIKALDAALFLAGPDCPVWLDCVGLESADPLELLISGRIGKKKEGTSWRVKLTTPPTC